MPSPRILLAAGLFALGCADAAAQTVVKTQAATDLRCGEDELRVTRVDETADGGMLRARNGTLATPRAYRVSGCGRQLTYLCDDWNTYDQTPICRRE